jgi:hypothetical protein
MTSSRRRYGGDYQRIRAAIALEVIKGRATCWRPDCGKPIAPTDAWHLGHDDWLVDRNGDPIIRGPEHALCNLTAAGKKSALLRDAKRHTQRVTRLEW